MSIRLTGMASGLDTESMITDLMSAYNGTKQKKINDMTKYSWKMDAWSEICWYEALGAGKEWL